MNFSVRIPLRITDLDSNGHVRGPVYLEYADQARWCCLRAAGISLDELAEARLGPVNLETTITFVSELRAGTVDVSCAFSYLGKTGRVVQEIRAEDGTLVATVRSVTGLLDLRLRKLVPDSAARLREFAAEPALLGL